MDPCVSWDADALKIGQHMEHNVGSVEMTVRRHRKGVVLATVVADRRIIYNCLHRKIHVARGRCDEIRRRFEKGQL